MRRPHGEARRATAFADALDGAAVDQRLERETTHLVSVADAICRAELETPRPEFALALRERLMREAPQALAVGPRRTRRVVHVKPIAAPEVAPQRFRRRLGAASVVFAVAGGSFGLVSTSAQALPGDVLYPMKRGVERVELGLSQGQVAVGRTRLTQANERLWEVQRLVGRGDVDARDAARINDALSAFSTGAGSGAATMMSAYADRGNETTVTQVNEFASTSGAALTEMAPGLPAANDDAYEGAAKTINQLALDARAACAVCATTAVSPIPTTLQPSGEDPAPPPKPAPRNDGSNDDRPDDDTTPDETAEPTPGTDTKSPPPTRTPRVPDKTVSPTPPETGNDSGDNAGDDSGNDIGDKAGDELVKPRLKTPVKKITDPLLKGLLGDGTGKSLPVVPDRDTNPLG